MEKRKKIYEGKAKIVYDTDDPAKVIHYFKDDATAFNALKKGTITGKGVFNNQISSKLFTLLESKGIPTHFEKTLSDNEMLTKKLDIVLIEVVMRNVAAGSISKRLGIEEGELLPETVLEFYYKDDALGDPLINNYHIKTLNLATEEELKIIEELGFRINNILQPLFDSINLILVDFKLEFGKDAANKIFLADEISPDTCRLWDKDTKKKLDKDRFRRDLGDVESAYQEVFERIKSINL